MPVQMDHMVAIASGSKMRVASWGIALQKAAIRFMVVSPITAAGDKGNDTELCVASNDVNEARHALRTYVESRAEMMW